MVAEQHRRVGPNLPSLIGAPPPVFLIWASLVVHRVFPTVGPYEGISLSLTLAHVCPSQRSALYPASSEERALLSYLLP